MTKRKIRSRVEIARLAEDEPLDVVLTIVLDGLRHEVNPVTKLFHGGLTPWYQQNTNFGWHATMVLKLLQQLPRRDGAIGRVRLVRGTVPGPRYRGDRRAQWWIDPDTSPVTKADVKVAEARITHERADLAARRTAAQAAETRRERLYATSASGQPLPEVTEATPVVVRTVSPPPVKSNGSPSVRVDFGQLIPGHPSIVVENKEDARDALLRARQRMMDLATEKEAAERRVEELEDQITGLYARLDKELKPALNAQPRVQRLEEELLDAKRLITVLMKGGDEAHLVRLAFKYREEGS